MTARKSRMKGQKAIIKEILLEKVYTSSAAIRNEKQDGSRLASGGAKALLKEVSLSLREKGTSQDGARLQGRLDTVIEVAF